MRVVFVVDSVKDLNQKINMLLTHFGNDIIFVVKANLAPLFNTYGYPVGAIYNQNLARVIHATLLRLNVTNTVVCYASLEFNNGLLDAFTAHIQDGNKIVNVMPNYNAFEQFCNSAYNSYVRSIFKNEDSLASPKLQFLPEKFVEELLSTHFGNKMFQTSKDLTTTMFITNKEINKSLKVKTPFNKYAIMPILVALVLTAFLLMTLAFWGVKYLTIFIFVLLYVLDIFLSVVFQCKNYFDTRFLK